MKIVDRLKEELINGVYTLEDLESVMESHKYFPLELDEAEEDGILKFSNGRSQIYIKYSIKDGNEYAVSDVTYCVKKTGKTQVHALKNPADIKAMMDTFRNNGQNEWFLAFVLGLTLGRRVGDTLSLKWSDFYYENGNRKNVLDTLVEQKTNKTVEIKISDSTWKYLDWYMEINSLDICNCYREDIFPTPDKDKLKEALRLHHITSDEFDKLFNKEISKQSAIYRYAFKKAAEANGIEGVSTHSTRKTFGYWGHKLNPYDTDNIDVLQTILGHASRETTKIYIDVMNEKGENIFDGVGQFVSDVDNGKPITIENSPVIALKCEDFRDILKMALGKGKQAEGDILDIMNDLLKEAESRRVS